MWRRPHGVAGTFPKGIGCTVFGAGRMQSCTVEGTRVSWKRARGLRGPLAVAIAINMSSKAAAETAILHCEGFLE